MKRRRKLLNFGSILAAAAATVVLAHDSCGQPLPSGIINVPGDYTVIGSPGYIGPNTTVNLFPRGIVRDFTRMRPGGTETKSELNVLGGTVGSYFAAFDGSIVNISSGVVHSIRFHAGTEGTISGGIIGTPDSDNLARGFFDAEPGSVVRVAWGRSETRSVPKKEVSLQSMVTSFF